MALLDTAVARAAQWRTERVIEGGQAGRDAAAVVEFQILQRLCSRDGRETVLADNLN